MSCSCFKCMLYVYSVFVSFLAFTQEQHAMLLYTMNSLFPVFIWMNTIKMESCLFLEWSYETFIAVFRA